MLQAKKFIGKNSVGTDVLLRNPDNPVGGIPANLVRLNIQSSRWETRSRHECSQSNIGHPLPLVRSYDHSLEHNLCHVPEKREAVRTHVPWVMASDLR